MRYEILDDNDNVINTIVAEQDFVDQNYPGKYRLIPEPVIIYPKTYARLNLIEIFGDDYTNIVAASKTDAAVEVWLEKFRLQDNFSIADTKFQEMIAFLVTKNLITQTKADSILN